MNSFMQRRQQGLGAAIEKEGVDQAKLPQLTYSATLSVATPTAALTFTAIAGALRWRRSKRAS
jgi:hypothetical protein